jgi:WXG100 family type VII secretion target
MSTLHIEPDELRTLSRLMDQSASQLVDAASRLQSAAANLEMAWQGGSSEAFVGDLQNMKQSLQARTEELNSYVLLLLHQSDRWDELDQTWQNKYRDFFSGNFLSGE